MLRLCASGSTDEISIDSRCRNAVVSVWVSSVVERHVQHTNVQRLMDSTWCCVFCCQAAAGAAAAAAQQGAGRPVCGGAARAQRRQVGAAAHGTGGERHAQCSGAGDAAVGVYRLGVGTHVTCMVPGCSAWPGMTALGWCLMQAPACVNSCLVSWPLGRSSSWQLNGCCTPDAHFPATVYCSLLLLAFVSPFNFPAQCFPPVCALPVSRLPYVVRACTVHTPCALPSPPTHPSPTQTAPPTSLGPSSTRPIT